MKKYLFTIFMFLNLSIGVSLTANAEWKRDAIGWWYQNDDGSYDKDGWYTINDQSYYFDKNGYMLENTLTEDGYWVDENGYTDESKKIYGRCVFNPVSYEKSGDKIIIKGNICDTGYGRQVDIEKLQAGSMVFTPDIHSDRVCEFNMIQPVDQLISYDGKSLAVVCFSYYDGYEVVECEYYLGPESMSGESTNSMPWPMFRIIQKEVTLIADANTRYSWDENVYECDWSMEECLKNWIDIPWPNSDRVWEIKLKGSHIDEALNIGVNYTG